MAGRITISAGTEPVILTGLDATNATPAYADVDLTIPFLLPYTVTTGHGLTIYTADSASITPTVKDVTGQHTISAVATACRAGFPVVLGTFAFTHAAVVA